MGSIRLKATALLSATLVGAAVLGLEPALLRDWSFETGQGRITVGAVRMPLLGVASAQTIETISLDDVSLTLGPVTYQAPRIDFIGVTASKAELQALFDKTSAQPLATRLAGLTARQVSIPELLSEHHIGEIRERSVARNLTANDVNGGRIRELIVGETETRSTGPKGLTRVTQGLLRISGLDVAALARLFVEKAGPQTAAMTRIYDAYEVGEISILDRDGISAKIARSTGRGVSARATDDSWSGVLSLLSAMSEMDQPSKEDRSRLVATMADLLSAFEIAFAEATGIEVRDPREDATAKIARIAYTGPSAGLPADMRMEGLDLTAKNGAKAKIATVSLTGFSFRSSLETLKSLKGRTLDEIDAATLRKLVPTIGSLRWSGLDFDLPNAESAAPQLDRIVFALKDLEVTADKPVNGIPSNIRFALQNLAFPLPATGRNDSLKPVLDLGYTSLDLSFLTAASWNETAREILLREISASGRDMGRLTLRGVLGNVTPDVFDPDTAVASVAALGATAKSVEVTVENAGLLERYLERESKRQKRGIDSLRREYGAAAALMIPVVLGNTAQAKSLGQAVARFIAKPGRLVIQARTRDPAGLSLTDLVGITEPASIFDQLVVTATTEDRL